MQKGASLSYLVLTVYVLMLLHKFIPHSHSMSLWQLPAMQVVDVDIDNSDNHQLNRQMPHHSHPQHSEYYVLKSKNVFVTPVFAVTQYLGVELINVPVPVIYEYEKPSSGYLFPRIFVSLVSAVPLRAPPTV